MDGAKSFKVLADPLVSGATWRWASLHSGLAERRVQRIGNAAGERQHCCKLRVHGDNRKLVSDGWLRSAVVSRQAVVRCKGVQIVDSRMQSIYPTIR